MPNEKERNDLLGERLVKEDVITQEELVEAREREAESGTPWYRQLLQMKKMDFGPLESVMRYEFHSASVRKVQSNLGETLVNMRAITDQQLKMALKEQNKNGRLLGNILFDGGFVTRETISKALCKQYDLEYAELKRTPSEQEALDLVPESIARKNNMIPIKVETGKLIVLIASPQVEASLKDVGVILGKRIHPMLTTTNNIRAEITARYKGRRNVVKSLSKKRVTMDSSKVSKPKSKKKAPETKTVQKQEELEVATDTKSVEEHEDTVRFDDIAREAAGLPVVKLVNTIIEGAANSSATDIHLDPQEPEMRVRYRIDGVLHDVMSIPSDIETAVVSRLKIMSDMDITETRHPQDGHISLEIGDMQYDVRVATLPTFLGERIVLRMLDQSTILAGIKDLGLEPSDEKTLTHVIHQPYGMVLVTGPTGSGKTTSLYACLNHKNVMTDSIVTLEDPVEYQLSGINQVQIDPDINLTFASTLRASLRQDIDVLLVGEIRDAETAQIAIRAAMTGHLVFTTLHTNDAPEAISTLRNMGVPSFLIASALTAIVGQRLVRTICPECKTSYAAPKALVKSIGLPDSTKRLYKGKGCQDCYYTGAKGRSGIFEILDVTPAIRKMIATEEPVEKITKAAKLKSMADRCRAKVKKGLVTPEEYLRTIRA